MKRLVIVILTFLSVYSYSQNEQAKIGQEAPDFSLLTLDGKDIVLKKLNENGPVVLVVLRGWPGYQCPICTRQVGELLTEAERFKEMGVSVLMVYPGPSQQLQERAAEFSEDFRFTEKFYFTIDPEYKMVNLYGLRWDAPKETAYPSTFVINQTGEIVFAKISSTHGGRAGNDEIFNALTNLY